MLLLVLWIGCISKTLSYNLGSISTIDANLAAEVTNSQSYVCIGGLQIDVLNSSLLLTSVCTPPSLHLSGGIGFLSIKGLSKPVEVVYGNVTADRPADGSYADAAYDEAAIVQAEYMYQTTGLGKILFVESRSCAREINRVTGRVTTIIGAGNCNNATLDFASSSGPRLVAGMTYYEDRDLWVFAVTNMGVYTYSRVKGAYVGRELLQRMYMSDTVQDSIQQLTRSDNVVWHKVNSGINMYDLSHINSTGDLALDSTFIRFLSSTGAAAPVDPSAKYRYTDATLMLGTGAADLRMSPNKQSLMIADHSLDRLFFLNVQNGALSGMCSKSGVLRDGDATSCTFNNIEAAVWLDDLTVLVTERAGSKFRRVRLVESVVMQTTIGMTPFKKAEEGTWWIIVAIISGFCAPLFVFWLVIKVIQCRRHGLMFDIFCDEDDDTMDPIAARKINFLYNKATAGQEYHGKRPATTSTEKRKSTKKRYRPKSSEDNSKPKRSGPRIPAKLQRAAESIADKFKLPKLRKKKKAADDDTDELSPVNRKPVKSKKRSSDASMDIDFAGSKVSVPMTKTLVGRARPLPSIPSSRTL